MIANYTTSGSKTLVSQGGLRKLIVQVNAALTGTITIAHQGGTTIATITNPTVGLKFEYWDLLGAVTVNPSTTCDITCSGDGSRGPK